MTTHLNPLVADVPVELQDQMKAHAAAADRWLDELIAWLPGYVQLSEAFQRAIRHHPDVDNYPQVYAGTGWDQLDHIDCIIYAVSHACEGGTAKRLEDAEAKIADLRTALSEAQS